MGDRSDINKIRDLLQRGADINGVDTWTRTPLLILARKGDESVPIIVELLKHENLDLNAKDNYGHTALIWASRDGHEEVVRILLQDDRLEVDAKDNARVNALTHQLIAEVSRNDLPDINIVRDLFQRGADINGRADHWYSRTPVMILADKVDDESTQIIIEF